MCVKQNIRAYYFLPNRDHTLKVRQKDSKPDAARECTERNNGKWQEIYNQTLVSGLRNENDEGIAKCR